MELLNIIEQIYFTAITDVIYKIHNRYYTYKNIYIYIYNVL